MNDRDWPEPNRPGQDRPDPEPPEGDAEVDSELSRIGHELRAGATPLSAHSVVASAEHRRVTRLQRSNRILAAVAAVLVVAMIGGVAWAQKGAPRHNEVASGVTLRGPQLLAAEKLVASLPDQPIDPHKVQLVASVSRYGNCDALADQLRKVGAAHVGSQGFGANFSTLGFSDGGYAASPSMQVAADSARSESGTAGSVSSMGLTETLGTNVIVDGVDEPDQVKAVGTLAVELNGSSLRVIDTSKPGIVGVLPLGEMDPKTGRSRYPISLLVEGKRVIVFGTESVQADAIPGDPSASRPYTNYMTVTFVSLADPTAPKVTQRVRIEGGLVAARRVGDSVRVVTNSSLNDLPMVAPMTANGVTPALHQNRLAVAGSAVDDWIPAWDTGASTPETPLVGCPDVVVPDTFAGVEMTSLVQFDMDGPFEPHAIGILAPSENLTATATDAVVASHVWVDPINQTEDYKDWSTALHRFSFAESGPRYVGSGQVKGSIRDQFSLAVINGSTMGVVTVDVLPWTSNEKAKITVRSLLSDPGSKSLKEAGSLIPADSGSGIGGLRFMGDRLLISSGTFGSNRVSSVDLSTPTLPKDLGWVDLPGSGEYFHPLGENRVLVIGSTSRVEGKRFISGMHSTLLDISGQPRILGKWSADGVSSNVAGDHHGFTWWNTRSMAGFGVYLNRNNDYSPPEALFLNVGVTEVEARMVRPQEADLGRYCPPDVLDRTGCDDSGPPTVSRVLVVNSAPWLYTSESLERLEPDSLASTALVTLPPLL